MAHSRPLKQGFSSHGNKKGACGSVYVEGAVEGIQRDK